jgi:hypothetical protein
MHAILRSLAQLLQFSLPRRACSSITRIHQAVCACVWCVGVDTSRRPSSLQAKSPVLVSGKMVCHRLPDCHTHSRVLPSFDAFTSSSRRFVLPLSHVDACTLALSPSMCVAFDMSLVEVQKGDITKFLDALNVMVAKKKS